MGKIMLNGIQYGVGGIEQAKDISYDNTESGATATDVQGALDELNAGLTWKTAGQVTGKTSISLPSEYNEIFIISYAPTHYIYLQLIPRGALVSSERLIANGFQSSYYATWYVSETAVRLSSYKDNGNDYSSSCSTTVYYR